MSIAPLTTVPLLSPVTDPSLLASQAQGAKSKDIDAVASGFESMFTSMLVKQLRQSLGEETMFGKDPGDILGGLFDLYLGQHLARGGMLGIGAMVKKQLQARAHK